MKFSGDELEWLNETIWSLEIQTIDSNIKPKRILSHCGILTRELCNWFEQ